ncbi:MAG: M42 family peptidase [Clostridia bacterium]|nr:M42 family peptidase [Clostridia bacterium]
MLKTLKSLCLIDATSGDETAVREFICKEVKDFCECSTDNLGNLICFKKGKKTPNKKIMLDAHMDEVGLIIKAITPDGYLKFQTVGGIDTSVMLSRRVLIENEINGVIGCKPVHLSSADERKKLPKEENLYIDIGASSRQEAQELVSVGDRAVICSEYIENGDKIISKALDDRIGCAVLIDLIKNYDEYDFYGVFSVQEEVGARGAKVATFGINPDSAIVLEGTTAADIADVPSDKTVCVLGNGVAVSFMDKGAVYYRPYYDFALNSNIKCQPKSAVAGGNNSSVIHLSRDGVKTVALSVPCRYIHSACSVADKNDILSARELCEYMINAIADGSIE